MIVQRVEKHIIKENHKYYKMLDDFCFKSKNLYNFANYQVRQCFVICSKLADNKKLNEEQEEFLTNLNLKVDEFNKKKLDKYSKDMKKGKIVKEPKLLKHFGVDNKFIPYSFNDFLCKGLDYSSMPSAGASQQCLRLLEKNWKSFFVAIKDWSMNKNKYTGRPKLPKYLSKNGRNILILTNVQVKLKNGYIQFPKSFNGFILQSKCNNLQQVRILPRNKHIVIEIVYNLEVSETKQDNGRYIGIDIGLDNLATLTNNVGIQPVIISGRKLKSINKYYNKQMSHYREIAKRMNNLDYTNRMNKLTIKRNNMITDLIHKASKSIINYALSCGVNTIVIGNNKDWKRNSSMSKKVNQSFVGIPHQILINQIIYKAENVGIKTIITEESYTSGTSFLDNELPIKQNYNKSRRIHRGLFKSNLGKLINADVNGSLQIIKKVFSNAFSHGIEDYGFNPIRVDL